MNAEHAGGPSRYFGISPHGSAPSKPCELPRSAIGFYSRRISRAFSAPPGRSSLRNRLREQKSVTQQKICFRRKDGEPVLILTNLNLVESDDEPGVSTIVGTSFDITERKESREALRESEQRLAAFMRHLPGVGFMKNRQGQNVLYTGG